MVLISFFSGLNSMGSAVGYCQIGDAVATGWYHVK